MSDPINNVLRPFEGKIHPGYPTGLKLYLQATKGIYKEAHKLDIPVSNSKDIIDHFLSLANKHGWGRLAFVVNTGTGTKNICRAVYQIHIEDIHIQALGYFGTGRNWKCKSSPSKPIVSISSTKFSHQCTVSTKFI